MHMLISLYRKYNILIFIVVFTVNIIYEKKNIVIIVIILLKLMIKVTIGLFHWIYCASTKTTID